MDKCHPTAKEGVSHTSDRNVLRTDLWRGFDQIHDLETRNAALTEELSLAPSKRSASQTEWIPRAPAGRVLTGHRGEIYRVAFHPSYSLLASASLDGVKIWDWETGELERTLKGHTRPVSDIDFDSKGNLLGACALMDFNSLLTRQSAVSCSADTFIKVWDTQNDWKNTKTFPGHDHSVSSVRFLPGDDLIVSASRDKSIRVWNIAMG